VATISMIFLRNNLPQQAYLVERYFVLTSFRGRRPPKYLGKQRSPALPIDCCSTGSLKLLHTVN